MAKTKINNRHALKWAAIGWACEKGNTRVFWSSHGYADGQTAFNEVVDAIQQISVALIQHISRINGEEEILLCNGSRIIFRSRISRAVRGISSDKLILDQAWRLTDEQLGQLVVLMAAGRGADIVYSGTKAPEFV